MTTTAQARSSGRNRRRFSPFDVVVTAVCGALVLLIVYPLAGTLVNIASGEEGSVTGTFADVFTDRRLLTVLGNTALVIGVSCLIAIVLGSTLAWLNERTNARLGWASDVLPVVSLLVPSTAGAIGWVLLASPGAGFLNVIISDINDAAGIGLPQLNIFSRPGMIFVYSLYMIPQVYLVVASAMRNIDPALEEAARVSGRRTFAVVRTVTLPAVAPAIVAGAVLSLVFGIAMFSVPLIIGTQANVPILTVEIVRKLTVAYPPDLLGAVLLSLLLLVAILGFTALSRVVTRRGHYATIGGRGAAQNPYAFGIGGRTVAWVFMFGYMALGCALPVAALTLVSFQPFWTGSFTAPLRLRAYEQLFRSGSETYEALTNSLVLGIAAATICMVVAILVAYRIGRSRRFGALLDTTTKIPGTVSHVIFAIAFVSALAGPPLRLGGTLTILLLAYVVLYITQATVSSQSAAAQVGKDLLDASRVSGRGPAETLRRISLPLMAPGIAAGWVFVFVLVVGDITASAILAGTKTPVVGFTMLSLFQNGTYPNLAALATVITVLSMVVVGAALVWVNRARKRVSR
ncbi:ABC transporter permease [Dactylosporangium sp. CA-152071]|uniref:ABC transporter permease n=1 Tax=Dactylosporangium sp. CA-152071 TaxID=3239933 RepID=UPI003D8A62AF